MDQYGGSGNWRSSVSEALRATETNLLTLGSGQQRKRSSSAAPTSSSAALPGTGTPFHHDPASGPAFVRSYADNMKQVRSSLSGFSQEIELERARREEDVYRVQQTAHAESNELREIVKQLQNDNAAIRRSVGELERRPWAPASSSGGSLIAATESTAADKAELNSLTERVYELEATVSRQQRVLDERNSRLGTLVSDAVNASVANEVERVRSVAREAARDATEDLVKVRTEAIQAMFANDISQVNTTYDEARRALQEATRTAEQSYTELWDRMKELTSRVDRLVENREGMGSQATETREMVMRILGGERERVNDIIALMKNELASAVKRQSAEALEAQQSLQHYVTQRMEVHNTNIVMRDEMTRTVGQISATLTSDLKQVTESAAKANKLLDETRGEHAERFQALHQEITKYRHEMDEHVVHAKGIEMAVRGANSTTEELREKLRSQAAELEVHRSAIDDQSARLRAVQHSADGSIETSQQRWRDVDGRVAETTQRVTALETKLHGIGSTISSVESRISTDSSSHAAAAASGVVPETVSADIKSIADRVKAVESKVTDMSNVSHVTSELGVLSESVSDVKTRLDAMNRQVDQMQQGKAPTIVKLREDLRVLGEQLDDERQRNQEELHEAKTELLGHIRKSEDRASQRINGVERTTKEGLDGVHSEFRSTAEEIGRVERLVGEAKQIAATDVRQCTARMQENLSLVAEIQGQATDAKERVARVEQSLSTANTAAKASEDRLTKLINEVDNNATDAVHTAQTELERRVSDVERVANTARQTAAATPTVSAAPAADGSAPATEAIQAVAEQFHHNLKRVDSSVNSLTNKLNTHAAQLKWVEEQHVSLETSVSGIDERVTSVIVENADSKRRTATAVQQAVAAEINARVMPLLSKMESVAAQPAEVVATPSQPVVTASTNDRASNNGELLVRVGETEAAIRIIRDNVTASIEGLQDEVKDISELLARCVISFVDTSAKGEDPHDNASAAAIGNLEDAFVAIAEKHQSLSTTLGTVWNCMSESVDVIRTQETKQQDTIEAIVRQNGFVQAIAAAAGLDPSDFAMDLHLDAVEEDEEEEE